MNKAAFFEELFFQSQCLMDTRYERMHIWTRINAVDLATNSLWPEMVAINRQRFNQPDNNLFEREVQLNREIMRINSHFGLQ